MLDTVLTPGTPGHDTPERLSQIQTAQTLQRQDGRLTAIVPAYNEAACIADTIASLKAQIRPPDEIIVVDDGSDDGTGDIARAAGVTVLRPPAGTGSKAGAQTFALPHVDSEFVMALDADTTLAPDAIALLLDTLKRDEDVAAACSTVVPRHVSSIWERGRYAEYLFAFSFFKPAQDGYSATLISSGCFSLYRTSVLRRVGGWSNRTMAEDMDLTWTLHRLGHRVRFVPEAVCYPIEPHDFRMLSAQLRRWSHGFIQNVSLHWRHLLQIPTLRSLVAVGMWDALIASMVYLAVLPGLIVAVSPLFALGYVIDLPFIAIPVLASAWKRGEVVKALVSLPCFFALRFVNSIFLLRAAWLEWVAGRSLAVYEKGH